MKEQFIASNNAQTKTFWSCSQAGVIRGSQGLLVEREGEREGEGEREM